MEKRLSQWDRISETLLNLRENKPKRGHSNGQSSSTTSHSLRWFGHATWLTWSSHFSPVGAKGSLPAVRGNCGIFVILILQEELDTWCADTGNTLNIIYWRQDSLFNTSAHNHLADGLLSPQVHLTHGPCLCPGLSRLPHIFLSFPGPHHCVSYTYPHSLTSPTTQFTSPSKDTSTPTGHNVQFKSIFEYLLCEFN